MIGQQLSCIALFSGCLVIAAAHSFLTDPEPITPKECRVGGPAGFVFNCRGPCNLERLEQNPPYANYYPEKVGSKTYVGGGKPAAVYRRGQRVKIKYARNNHTPGGFNRFTLVKPDDMMNRAAHDKNAFWHSCWGAEFEEATPADKVMNNHNKYFNLVGNDGDDHNLAIGYYTVNIVIPKCIPDGKYILGKTWYGGTGDTAQTNDPDEPGQYSYFGDYWSCAFVEIKGGDMENSCDVVFNADSKFSSDKCFASVDRLASPECKATSQNPQSFTETCQCMVEPCMKNGQAQKGSYMVPFKFKDGKKPAPLTPRNWGGKLSGEKSNEESNANDEPKPTLKPKPRPKPQLTPQPKAQPKTRRETAPAKEVTKPPNDDTCEDLRKKYNDLVAKVQSGNYIVKKRSCPSRLFKLCEDQCGV